MTTKYSGGCACGAVRYETEATPIFQNHCQCRTCQRRSGTGHGSYLTFGNRAEVTLTGQARTWQIAGDSGNEKQHGFCPACGTPVFLTFKAMPDLFTIHAASLDDPALFRPQVSTYATAGLPWDTLDRALPKFERMAPG